MITIKTILTPTDFSETSDVAVRYGRAMAETFRSSLHLLHVIPDPSVGPGEGAGEIVGFSPADLRERWERSGRKRLKEVFSEDDRKKLQVQTEIRVGHPFLEILRYAKDQNVDLIVMGTHGRGPVSHMLMGSVAEKVVRKAACPVLTVRHPQHEFVRV